jgi:hypothetical protein
MRTKIGKTKFKNPETTIAMYKDKGKWKKGKVTINEYILAAIADIDVNGERYKKSVMHSIDQEPISKEKKQLYKFIASRIKANSGWTKR